MFTQWAAILELGILCLCGDVVFFLNVLLLLLDISANGLAE